MLGRVGLCLFAALVAGPVGSCSQAAEEAPGVGTGTPSGGVAAGPVGAPTDGTTSGSSSTPTGQSAQGGATAAPPTGDAAVGPPSAGSAGSQPVSPGTDAGPGDPIRVRFVAVGDTGTGDAVQLAVASAIATVCATKGCDFVQLLGDNIYESGVDGTADPQWQTKFETPYASIDLPFWVVLGNHDNGGAGAGTEPARGDFQVQYGTVSQKWKLPARYYSHVEGPAEMFGLDTNAGMLLTHQTQTTEVAAMLDASNASWKVAFGHHPYLSNGPHGNAGNYEGLGFLPGINGAGVKELLDGSVCGKADVYICGHDHSLQWHEGTCAGTVLLVSGAGAKTTELPGQNATLYQSNAPGFLWVEISGDTFLGEFYDETGAMQFSRTFTK